MVAGEGVSPVEMAVEPEAGHRAGSRMNIPGTRGVSQNHQGLPAQMAGCFAVTKELNRIKISESKRKSNFLGDTYSTAMENQRPGHQCVVPTLNSRRGNLR